MTDGHSATGPRPIGLAGATGISGVVGFSIMNAEIAAGRLFAPYYGTSTTTWALLIGTVLLSLTGGSLLGGWLSRRPGAQRTLILPVLAAAVLLAILPRLAPSLMAGSLARFHSGEVAGLFAGGGAAAFLLAAPIICLGALGPLLFHSVGQVGHQGDELARDLGRIAGRLSAGGTVGSMLGTFAAGLVLIPWQGTARTIDVGAVLLLVTAGWLALRTAPVAIGALAAAATTAIALIAWPAAPPPPPTGQLVYQTESRLNHIAVVDVGGERQLRVNDGFAVQSFVRRDGGLPLRDVWAYYAQAPAWVAGPTHEVLLLGLGGGTSADLLARLYPEAHLTGVELDPAMVRVGREQLGLALPGVDVVIDDARRYVAAEAAKRPGRYDVIVLDAFQFPYVPFQLTTLEFFRDLDRVLAPGGVVVLNVGRDGEQRGVVHAIARTLATVFPTVRAADPHNRSNTILVASRHDPAQEAGLDQAAPHAAELAQVVATLPALAPARWPGKTPLLTDDHAPVEWLTDRIIWSSL